MNQWTGNAAGAPANLEGLTGIFSPSSHTGPALQEDTESTIIKSWCVPLLDRRMGLELAVTFTTLSPASAMMTCWASLLRVAGLGLVALPPVETEAFGARLEAQVSVEGDFSVRNQT